jgi:hypothetical protein
MAALQATFCTFSDATIARTEPLALVAIFTMPAGFSDPVDFVIDDYAQRIDFGSPPLVGLHEWGTKRSRMDEPAVRFEKQNTRCAFAGRQCSDGVATR